MNKVTGPGWSEYSYNPVSGCRHPCRDIYCYNTTKSNGVLNRFGSRYYDRKTKTFMTEKKWRKRETKGHRLCVAIKGEKYPHGYDPCFYPHRLHEPRSPRITQRVFVSDVGDLFGSWIPDRWIQQVIDAMKTYPWHKYFLCTKNPKRYVEFVFPTCCWLGATVTSDADVRTLQIMQNLSYPKKYLSIEPLMGPLTASLRGIQWIVIGAMTGEDPFVPENVWVDEIVKQARKRKILIYMKENLLKTYNGKVYQQVP